VAKANQRRGAGVYTSAARWNQEAANIEISRGHSRISQIFMKRFILPSCFALLLAGCNVGPAASNDTAPAAATVATANSTNAPEAVVADSKTNAPAVVAAESVPPANASVANSELSEIPKAPPELPAPVGEVVRLAQHTIGESILVDYIGSVQEPYTLNADQIIYLHDLGISPGVMQALLKHSAGPAPTPLRPVVTPTTAFAPDMSLPMTNALSTEESSAIFTNYLTSTPVGPPLGVPRYAPPPEAAAPFPPPPPSVAAATPQPPVESSMVYDTLSPYGDWVETPDYGWAWQPTVAVIDTNWRPYLDSGNWMWSDAGWYWNSTYSWGWLPFHYGRWGLAANRGWVWIPDSVWAPAWVTWRYTDSACGWAPLPPVAYWSSGIGLTFRGARVGGWFDFGLTDTWFCAVPYGRFCDPWLPRYCLPRPAVGFFVGNSRVINNFHGTIVNIHGNNNTVIVNNGPGIGAVQAATRQEIVRHNLHDLPSPGAALPLPSRPTPAGLSGPAASHVAVFRGQLPQSSAQPPTTVLARQENRDVAGTTYGGTRSAPLPSRPTQSTVAPAGGSGHIASQSINSAYRSAPATANYAGTARSEPSQPGRTGFAGQPAGNSRVNGEVNATWQRPPAARPTVQPRSNELVDQSEPVRVPTESPNVVPRGGEAWAPNSNEREAAPNTWQQASPAYVRPAPYYPAGAYPNPQSQFQPAPQVQYQQPGYSAPAVHAAPPAAHYAPAPAPAAHSSPPPSPGSSSSGHTGGGNGRTSR
jgi:hypothetical protein